MKHKNRLIIYLILGIFVISGMLLVSYGYMGSDVSGNETAKEFVNLSQILKVEYSGGTENLTTKEDGYFAPGSVLTKTFSIKNTGNVNINYGVKLSDVVNDFEREEDLVYELYLEDTLLITGIFPITDTVLAYSQTINVGETKNYTLKVIYTESEENQIVDQNKIINAKIDFVQTKNTLSNIKILGNTQQGRLPSEYQEVEYIESTGTQYIDTGVKPTSKTKVELEYLSNKIINEPFEVILGAQNIEENKRFFILEGKTNNFQINIGIGDTLVSTTIIDNEKHKYVLDSLNKNAYYDTDIHNYTSSLFESLNYSIYMFGRNENGNIGNLSNGKLYYLKIYENDIMIRNYIPCYRISDNVIGLYDLIEGKFYTNQGSGSFNKGSNIGPTPTEPLELKSVGNIINVLNINSERIVFKGKLQNDNYKVEKGKVSFKTSYYDINNNIYGLKFKVEPNTDYVLTYKTLAGRSTNSIYDLTGNRIGYNNLTDLKFNSGNNSYLILHMRSNAWDLYTELTDVMISKSNNSTNYEQYGYKIPLKVENENILNMDKHTITKGYYLDSSGGTNSSNSDFIKISSIPVEPNKTYTFSSNVFLYSIWYFNGSTAISKLYSQGVKTKTFTTPDNCTYIRISLDLRKMDTSNGNGVDLFRWAMLQEGKGDGIYKEYNPINIYLEEPLRGIDSYQDILDFSNKQVVRKIGSVSLINADNLSLFSYNPYPYIYYSLGVNGIVLDDISMSSHFLPQSNFSYTKEGNNTYRILNSSSYKQTRIVFRLVQDGNIVNDLDAIGTFFDEQNNNNTPVTFNYAWSNGNEINETFNFDTNLLSINPDAEITVDTEVAGTVIKE